MIHPYKSLKSIFIEMFILIYFNAYRKSKSTPADTISSLGRNISDIIKSSQSACLFNQTIVRGIQERDLVSRVLQQRFGSPLLGSSQDHLYSLSQGINYLLKYICILKHTNRFHDQIHYMHFKSYILYTHIKSNTTCSSRQIDCIYFIK